MDYSGVVAEVIWGDRCSRKLDMFSRLCRDVFTDQALSRLLRKSLHIKAYHVNYSGRNSAGILRLGEVRGNQYLAPPLSQEVVLGRRSSSICPDAMATTFGIAER